MGSNVGDWWDLGLDPFDVGEVGSADWWDVGLNPFEASPGFYDAVPDMSWGGSGGDSFQDFYNASANLDDWSNWGGGGSGILGEAAPTFAGASPDLAQWGGSGGADVSAQPTMTPSGFQMLFGQPGQYDALGGATINLGQLLGPAAGAAQAGIGAATGGGTGGQATPVRLGQPLGGSAGVPGAGTQQAPGLLNSLLSPQGILGAAGLAAGLGGALASGGQTGSQRGEVMPALIPERASIGPQANAAWTGMQPFAQGMTPLQQQQNSLLGALASGQGLPLGYQQLVEQAFQPAMGDIASQAIESARRRGFAGGAGLLQEGPAGAIAGPALANLQGQMAQAKLGLMQTLPGLYNTPIQTQGGFQNAMGQGLNQLGASYPSGQQQQGSQSVPLFGQMGNMINNALTGFGGALAQQQQQQQQQNMLQQFFPQNYQQQGGGNGGVGGMSYWGV